MTDSLKPNPTTGSHSVIGAGGVEASPEARRDEAKRALVTRRETESAFADLLPASYGAVLANR
ncbi:MAG: hypothetical protein IT381_21440 [Deltaproteobacteria bacterium]|nr:hypothetical protein [Deltaproteobacteria bacterium]